MKLHLPSGLRKALLSCLAALSTALPVTLASGTLVAEDITLGGESSIAPDEELDAEVDAALRAAEEQEEALLISGTSFGIAPDPLSRSYSGNFDDISETVLQPASGEGTLALDSTVDRTAELARQSLLRLKEDRLFSNTAVIASDGVKVLEATATPEGVPGILAANNWGLVFEDQFDGKSSDDSALNTRLWTRIPYESPNQVNNWRANQSIDKNLVSFEDKEGNSTMRLWGRYGRYTNQNNQNNTTQDVYACGGVRSQGVFSFQYGYVEVRAKYENAKGVWPAIWMMPERVQAGLDGGGWPRSGEIDIMEHLNYEGIFYQTLHRAAAKGGVDSQISVAKPTLNKDAWHTYGVEWTAQSITFYLDGGQTGKIAWDESGYTLYGAKGAVTGSHTWTAGERELWPFDYTGNTFYLILDQQIGGGWPGNPDDASKAMLTNQGVSMWIDYVKVYSDVDKYSHFGKCTLTWKEAGGTWAETEGSLWDKGAFQAADSVVFGEVTTKDVTISGAVHTTNMDVNAAGYTFSGAGDDAKLVVRETLTLAEGATANLAVNTEIGRLSGAGNLTTSGTGKTLFLYTWNGDYSADPYTGTITVSDGWNVVVSSAGVSAGTIDLTQQGDDNYLAFDNNNPGVYQGDITLNANLVGLKNVKGRGGRKVTITGTVSGVDRVLSVTKYSGAGFSNCFVFEGDVSRFTGFDATANMANTASLFPGGVAAFTFKAGLALSGDTTFNVGNNYGSTSDSTSRYWMELTETSRLTGEGDIIKTGAGELEIDGDTSGYSGTMRLQAGKLILDGIDGSRVDVSLENATAEANVVNLNASKREGASGGVLRSVGMGGEAVSGKVMLGAGASWTLQEVTLTTGETLTIGGASGSSITLGGAGGMNLTGGRLVLGAGVAFGGQLNITLTGSELPTGLIGLEAGTNLKGLKLNLIGLQRAVAEAGGVLEWKYQLFSLPTVGEDGQNDVQKALAQEWLNGTDVSYEGYALFVDESGFIFLRKANLVWNASNPPGTVWKEEATGWGEGGTDAFQAGCTVTFGATSAATTVTIEGPVSVNNMNVNGAYTFRGNVSNSQLKVGGTLNLGGNATIELLSTIAVLSGTGDLTIGNTGANVVTITEVGGEFTGSIKLAANGRLTLSDTKYAGTLKLTGDLAYLIAKNGNLNVEAEGEGNHVLSFFYAQQIGNATGLSGINVGGQNANVTVKDLTAGVGGATFTFDNSRNGQGVWAGYSGQLTVTGNVEGYEKFVAHRVGVGDHPDILFSTGTVVLKEGTTTTFETTRTMDHHGDPQPIWAPLSTIEFGKDSTITGTNTTIVKTGEGKLKIAGDTSGLTGTLRLEDGVLELNGIDGSGIDVMLENATASANVVNLGGNGGVLKSVGVGGAMASGKVTLGAGASWTLNGVPLATGKTLTITGEAGSGLRFGGEDAVSLTAGTLELGRGVAFSGGLQIALTGNGDPTGLIKLQENANLGALGLSLTGLSAALEGVSISEWRYKLFSGSLVSNVLTLATNWLVGADLGEDYADYKLVPNADGTVSLKLRYLTWDSQDGVWQSGGTSGDWRREGIFENGETVTFADGGTHDVAISGAVKPGDMTVSADGYTFGESGSGANSLEVTGTLHLEEATTTTLGLKTTIARLTGGTAPTGGEEGLAVAAEIGSPELVIERPGEDPAVAYEVWIKDASEYNGTIRVGEGGFMVVRLKAGTGTFTAPGTTVDLSEGGVLAFDNNGGTSDGAVIYGGNVVFDANLTGVTGLQGKGGWQVTVNGSVQGVNDSLTVSMYNAAGFSDCLVFAGDVSGFTGFNTVANMCNVSHFTQQGAQQTIAAFRFEKGLELAEDTTFNVGKYSNGNDGVRHWIELTETSRLTGEGDIIKTGVGELEIDGDTSGYSGTMRLQEGKLILDGIDGSRVDVSLENTAEDANVLNLNGKKRTTATDAEGEEGELTGSILRGVVIGGEATRGKVVLGAGANWTLNGVSPGAGKTLTISGEAGSSVTLGGDEGVSLTDGTLALEGAGTFYGALNVALAEGRTPRIGLTGAIDLSNLGLRITGLSDVIGEDNVDTWSYQLFSEELSGDPLTAVQNWLRGVELEAQYADLYRLSVRSNGEIYLRALVLKWTGNGSTTWTEGSTTDTWAQGALFERGDQVLFGEDASQKAVQIDGGVTASEVTVEVDGYTFSEKASGESNDALTVTGTLNLAESTTTTLGLKATIARLAGEGVDGAAPELVIARAGATADAAHEVWIKDASGYNGTIKVNGGGLMVVRLETGTNGIFTAPGMTVDLSGGGVLAFDNNSNAAGNNYYNGDVSFDANLTGVTELQAKGGRKVTLTGAVQGNGSSLTAEKYNSAGLSACFVFEGAVSGFTGFNANEEMCNPTLHGQKTIAAFTFKDGLALNGNTTFSVGDYDNVEPVNRYWIELTETSRLTGEGDIIKTGAGELEIDGDTSGYSGTMRLQAGKLILDGIDGGQVDVSLENATAEANVVNLNASKSKGASGGVLKSVGMGETATSGKVELGAGASWTLNGVSLGADNTSGAGKTLTITGGEGSSLRFGGEGAVSLTAGTVVLGSGVAFSGELQIALTGEDDPTRLIGLQEGANLEALGLTLSGLSDSISSVASFSGWSYQLFSGSLSGNVFDLATTWLAGANLGEGCEDCKLVLNANGTVTLDLRYLTWGSEGDGTWQNGESGTDGWKREATFDTGKSVVFGDDGRKNVTVSGEVKPADMTVSADGYTFGESGSGANSLEVTGTLHLEEATTTTLGLKATIARLTGGTASAGGEEGLAVAAETAAPELIIARSGATADAAHEVWIRDASGYNGTIKVGRGGLMVVRLETGTEGTFSAPGTTVDLSGGGVLAFDNNSNADGNNYYNGDVVFDAELTGVTGLQAKGGRKVTMAGTVQGNGSLTVEKYGDAGASACLVFEGAVSGFTGFSTVADMCDPTLHGQRTIAAFTFKDGLALDKTTTFDVSDYDNVEASANRYWVELTETSRLSGTGDIIKTGAGELEIDGNTSGYSGTMRLRAGKLVLDGVDGSKFSVSLENAEADDNVVNLNATKRAGASGGVLKSVGVGGTATSGKVMLGEGTSWALRGVELTGDQQLTIGGSRGSRLALEGLELKDGTLALAVGVGFTGQLGVALSRGKTPRIGLSDGTDFEQIKLSVTGLSEVVGEDIENWSYRLFAEELPDWTFLSRVQAWLKKVDVGGEYPEEYRLSVRSNGEIYLRSGILTWLGNGAIWTQDHVESNKWAKDASFESGDKAVFGPEGAGVVPVDGAVITSGVSVNATGYTFAANEGGEESDSLTVDGTLNLGEGTETAIELATAVAELSGAGNLTIATKGEKGGKNAVTINDVGDGFTGAIKLANNGRLTLKDSQYAGALKLTGELAYLVAKNGSLNVEGEGAGAHVLSFFSAQQIGNATGLSGINVGGAGATATVRNLTAGAGGTTFTFDNSRDNTDAAGWAASSGRLAVTGAVSGYTGFVARHAGGQTGADIVFSGTVNLGAEARFETTASSNHSEPQDGWAALSTIEFSSGSAIRGSNTTITKTGAGNLRISGDTSGLSGKFVLQEGTLVLDNIAGEAIDLVFGGAAGAASDGHVTLRSVDGNAGVLRSVQLGKGVASGVVDLASGANWTFGDLGIVEGQTLTLHGYSTSNVTFAASGDRDRAVSGGKLQLEGGTYGGSLSLMLGVDVATKGGAQILFGEGVEIGRDGVNLDIVMEAADPGKLIDGWKYQLFTGLTPDLAARVVVLPNEELRKRGCAFTMEDDGFLVVKRLGERYWNGEGDSMTWGGDSSPWTDREGDGPFSWESADVWQDRDYMDVHFTATGGEHSVVLAEDIVADQLSIAGATETQSYAFSGAYSLRIKKGLDSGENTDLSIGNEVTVEGQARVRGSLTVRGGATLSVGTASSARDVVVQDGGKLTAGKGLEVQGTLAVQGTAELGDSVVGGVVTVGHVGGNSPANLTVSGTLTTQTLDVQGGVVSLQEACLVRGDASFGRNARVAVAKTLDIGGGVEANGGNLVISEGGRLTAGAWDGALSSLTLNKGTSVTVTGSVGILGFGTLTHNGDSDLMLDGLKSVDDGGMLKVDRTAGEGTLTVHLLEEFLNSIAHDAVHAYQYTLFDVRDCAGEGIAGVEIASELGYIMEMDWETGVLTVLEKRPSVDDEQTYISSEDNGGDGSTWQKQRDENLYYDVSSYGAIKINKNTTIDITGEKRPDNVFGEIGLVMHNLYGGDAETTLSVVGSEGNDIVTIRDWEDEKTDNTVVYRGNLVVKDAKLRIDHGKRDNDGNFNRETAANVTANMTGKLDLSQGQGLEMVLGVLELSGAENDFGSAGVAFTNGLDSQLILSGGVSYMSGEITAAAANNDLMTAAATDEAPAGEEEEKPAARQEHILLREGATLSLGRDSESETIIGDNVVIGRVSTGAETAAGDDAGETDASENSEILPETVFMQGKVDIAGSARLTGVHLKFANDAAVNWNAGAAADQGKDEVLGLIAVGGALSGDKDIAIRVTEWSSGVTDHLCTGTDFSAYTGKMTVRKSEYNQVFTGVRGNSAWDMEVEEGGRVVFDLLDEEGRNAAWAMGDVTLNSGATLTLQFTLDGPTMLRANSQPNMSFHSFVAGEGARLVLCSEGIIPPTEESYVLGTVGDAMQSRIESGSITPELLGSAFWRVGQAEVCLEGNELLLKIVLDGHNKLLEAMGPDAPQNARDGAEALWELTGMTDNARVMEQLADPNSDIAKLANDAELRRGVGDLKGLEKQMASAVGASLVGVAPALGQDMHRQLSAIRNRAVSSGAGIGSAPVADDATLWHAWINAESGYHELDDDGLRPGYRLNGWGGTVGVGADVSRYTTVGLALSAMYNDLKSGAADSMTSDLDTCYLSFFERHVSGRWSHTLVLSIGMASLDSERTVALTGGSYTAKGDTDGYTLGALYEIGYTHGGDPERTGALQSVANVEFRHVSLDGFDEEGTAAALHVDDMEQTVVTFGAGFRYQRFVGTKAVNRSALFELRALAKVDAGDTRGEAATSFLDGLYRTNLRGAEIGRVGAEVGAGVTVPLGRWGSVFVDGSVELRSGYTSFDASAGYKINF